MAPSRKYFVAVIAGPLIVGLVVLSIVALLFLAGQSRIKGPVRGLVLSPGDVLEVTNEFGSFKITATGPVSRRFEWSGNDWEDEYQIARVSPWTTRPHDRSTGIAYYGAYSPKHVRHNGAVVIPQEAELEVESSDDTRTIEYLKDAEFYAGTVWSSEGVFVRAKSNPHPGGGVALGISIHRLLVNGEAPKSLPPCKDGTVRWIKASPSEPAP